MPALEGSITEFGLADILQLIYYQRKTGVLTVRGKYDTIKVTFFEGNILDVTSTRRPEDKRLGQILLKKKKITPEQLQHLLQKQKATGKRIGQLLMEEAIVSKEEIEQIIIQQIIDQMVVMFSWKEGYYVFKAQRVTPREDELHVLVDTQHVLMEGLRIVDEWSVVEGIISPNTVFKKKADVEPVLNELQQKLWEQIDGETDVATIVDALGEEDLAVSKALLEMLEKGYIEPVEESEEEVEAEQKKSFQSKINVERIMMLAFAVVFVLILGIGFFRVSVRISDFMKILMAKSQIDRLTHMVELYYKDNGFYPESISSKWVDPWGHPIIYRLTDRGYRIFSAGPDGKVSTSDDIY